jgi:prophage regulatory protein
MLTVKEIIIYLGGWKMEKKKEKARIIRKQEVLSRIPLSEASIYRKERLGQFPKRVQLGDNSVGWLESEVDEWFEKMAAERDIRVK